MSKLFQKTLKASDVMQTDVVIIGPKDSLQEAMNLITEHHVTGLPVLDARDRCVGVVSASDILSFVEEQTENTEDAEHSGQFFNPDEHRWESIGVSAFAFEECGETPISEIMSRDLISVSPDTPVEKVAQLMDERQVHRILVLDNAQHLRGIISAFDFVRLIAAES